jgi:hypothetical protein
MTTFPPKSPCPTCGSDLAIPAAPPVQMEAVGYILDSELDKLRRGMTTTAAISPRPYVKDDVPIFASPVPSPVQMEAVAWRFKYRDCLGWLYRDERDWIPNEPYNVHDVQPLYASPVLLPDGYVMGWQDISTAPIGTYALLFSERDRDISIRDFGQFAKYNSPKFTHWMPLPQLPIGTGEGR